MNKVPQLLLRKVAELGFYLKETGLKVLRHGVLELEGFNCEMIADKAVCFQEPKGLKRKETNDIPAF